MPDTRADVDRFVECGQQFLAERPRHVQQTGMAQNLAAQREELVGEAVPPAALFLLNETRIFKGKQNAVHRGFGQLQRAGKLRQIPGLFCGQHFKNITGLGDGSDGIIFFGTFPHSFPTPASVAGRPLMSGPARSRNFWSQKPYFAGILQRHARPGVVAPVGDLLGSRARPPLPVPEKFFPNGCRKIRPGGTLPPGRKDQPGPTGAPGAVPDSNLAYPLK